MHRENHRGYIIFLVYLQIFFSGPTRNLLTLGRYLLHDTRAEHRNGPEVHGKDGVYSVFNIQQRSIKLNSFQRLASSNRYAAPPSISNDLEKLEKKYWQSISSNAPIYGAGTFLE